MRHLLYIMLVALLCGCNNSSTTEDEKSTVGKHPTRHGYGELPIDVLYGDIDSICQIRYKLTDRFGTTEEEIDGYKFIRFNEDGNVVEDVNYDKNLNISFRYIYDYNSKGHPRTMTICGANDVVIQQKIYTTDNMGNITSETSYGNDGLMDEKRVMKYDGDQIIEIKAYDQSGDMVELIDIKRNNKNLRFTYQDIEDNKRAEGTVHYNRSGVITAIKASDEDGAFHSLESECNKDGNTTKYRLISDNEVYMEVVREDFDAHNNALCWTVYEKDILIPTLRVEQTIYYSDGSNNHKISPIEEAAHIQEQVKKGLGRNGIYEVGDYYNCDGKQGVVFEVSDGGHHGKIVSLDETYLGWCTYNQYYNNVTVGASNAIDGKNNTDLVMARSDSDQYPAFDWCRDKGEDWYLPAHGELQLLGENLTAVNRTLAKYSTKISDSYWSSTEYLVDEGHSAWLVYPSSESIYERKKYNYINVRAVTTF